MQEVGKVKSLQKALDILDCFTPKTPELGVSEIARMLNLNKSNVHNILSTFEMGGYLRKNPRSEKYMLGNKMIEFSYTIMSSYKYTNMVLPIIEELSSDLNTVVYFGIPHGKSVLYLFSAYPIGYAKNLPYRSILGEKAPFYCTAIGKALLQAMPEDEILSHLPPESEREAFTPNTLIKDKDIIDNIATAKQRGYAIDNIEHEPNVRCVGVPVLDRNMTLVGAISASGPTTLVTTEAVEKISTKLLSAAFEIRSRL
ncbi:MAG: IclR family transcriptional regulator [Treponema sp.]|nr:IclR family transcriptional regulator [Treponema sp.]